MTVAVGVRVLAVLLVLEMPIAFAMMIAATAVLYLVGGEPFVASYLVDVYHSVSASYVFLTIPVYVLLAQFMAQSGMARDIIKASGLWLGRLRGGLGVACVMASAFMAAIIGSTMASSAIMLTAAFPSMGEVGYDARVSVGIIAISGTLAIMIPPSIVLIIYGIFTEQSMGRLLIAGLLPGLLTGAGCILTVVLIGCRAPEKMPSQPHFDINAATRALVPVWPVVLLTLLIIGGPYGGVATSTEIGARGAAAALAITLITRRMGRLRFITALEGTLGTTIMIVTIVIGAMMFGYFLTLTQATQSLFDAIQASGMPPWSIIAVPVLIYLMLGMLMGQIAILVLTVPVTYALVTDMGSNGIWFGIVLTKAVEIGSITPPLGLNVFVTARITRVSVADCFRGGAPFW